MDIPPLAGHTDSAAVGIDDRDYVVATSTSSTIATSFFWRDGTTIQLFGEGGLARAIAMNRNGRTVGAVGGTCFGGCYAAWDAPSPFPTSFGAGPAVSTLALTGVGDNNAPFAAAQVQRGCLACIHAVIWEPSLSTPMIDLGTVDGVTTTGSRAWAVNSLGQVAGTSGGHAVIWAPLIRDIGNLGSGMASAVDINDASEVAGTSATASGGPSHAFLWRAGVMQDLGTLNPGGSSEAIAINAAGDVVGNSGGHAVLWRAGTLIDLGTLGGASSTAVAINDAGQVIGNSQTAEGNSHAFFWQGGVMTDLGTLGGPVSSAKAINASGRVVGTSFTANGTTHTFVTCPAGSSTASP
jgi:probable HAF family extracellular repeat protein